MRYIFQEEKIDTVLHFAAQSHVGMWQMFFQCCWECMSVNLVKLIANCI